MVVLIKIRRCALLPDVLPIRPPNKSPMNHLNLFRFPQVVSSLNRPKIYRTRKLNLPAAAKKSNTDWCCCNFSCHAFLFVNSFHYYVVHAATAWRSSSSSSLSPPPPPRQSSNLNSITIRPITMIMKSSWTAVHPRVFREGAYSKKIN